MSESPPVIVMPPLGQSLTHVWHLLFDLEESLPGVWCLIGGLMVALHGLEHDRYDWRPSADADVLVNIRADPAALRRIAEFLTTPPRSLKGDPGPDGILHRFIRHAGAEKIVIDVLAPDNLGRRADLTTSPPGRTIQVPGGTQALNRAEYVRIQVEDRVGRVSRPALPASIIAKAAALNLPGESERHTQDLAFLLSLMRDPLGARSALSANERGKLRACPLTDRHHRAWRYLPETDADAGHAALRLLG